MSQRRVGITTTRVSRASTPVGNISRGGGALSPTRTTRMQEKQELQGLNDRLAAYIDKVRNLENENSRLTQQLQVAQENVNRETSNIKAVYERELASARKMLDEIAKDKAKLEIDIKRLYEENRDLKEKVAKLTKNLEAAENSARVYESRYNEANAKYNQALGDRKKAEDRARDLGLENEELRKQLAELRKQLETETLTRVDLENQNQSLREELAFKDQIHIQEVSEVRSRRQIDISEIDGRLTKQYEAKLQQSLQELREQYEAQMRANREEIELLYESQIKGLEAQANRANGATSEYQEEVRVMRSRMDELNRLIRDLEGANADLSTRNRKLEEQLLAESDRHARRVLTLEDELRRMREEMDRQLQDYKDLMDIKVSLDLELAAYGKMLDGEERRLNISSERGESSYTNGTHLSPPNTRSGASPSGRRSATPGLGGSAVKRRRTVVDESEDRNASDYSVSASAKGDLHILEADSEGRYIKLHNKGNEEHNLTGWQLTRIAGDEELAFKFSRGSKIGGGATVTVWSVDAGVAHDPPESLVMKKKWPVANSMRSILYNAEKEDIASYERIRTNTSSHASRHRNVTGGFSLGSGLFSLLF